MGHPGSGIDIKNGGGGKLRSEAVAVLSTPSDTHNGGLKALVKPGTDALVFTDEGSYGDGCHVRMQRIGPWFLDEDIGGCGGSGVSFLVLYRRKK